MNNDFQSAYLDLLKMQVEDEIQFLVTNGHDHTFLTTRCMFCYEHHSGKYHCRRLTELRQFLSNVMQQRREEANRSGRRPIGQAVPRFEFIGSELPAISEPPIFQMK